MIKLNCASGYLTPDAKQVDIDAASIVCTSPESQISSIDEQDQIGAWE